MEGSSSPRGAPTPLGPSANDRLKASWGGRVYWSTVLAVVLHAAGFIAWPAQFREPPPEEPDRQPVQLEWITISPPDPARQAQAPRGLPVLEEPDSIPSEQEDRPGTPEGEGEQFATVEEAFEARLFSSSAPRPVLAEPDDLEDETSDDSTGEPNEEDDAFDAGGMTADLPEWLGATPMELDRLSAVRPELAVVAPSSWVLIRNPREVETYIRRTYSRGDLPRGANGSVSVALWIDGRGRVEWAEISESSGRDDMDEVALAVFSEVAAFRPARDDGAPTPRSVVFSVQFPWVGD